MAAQVRIGVGVFVFNAAGAFIMGERKGSHGAGTWALPGGHLEFGESFETCAIREVLEETGLAIQHDSVRFLTATNDIMQSEGKHYVTVFMECRLECEGEGGEPQIMEPEKCERWEWVTWQDLRRWAEARLRPQDSEGPAAGTSGNAGAQLEYRNLFLPLLNLFAQRLGLDPRQMYAQGS